MTKFVFAVSLIILLISSCIIQLNSGNGFEYLSNDEKDKIKEYSKSQALSPNYIYPIFAKDLKRELLVNEKSLVYTFANGCKSENCLPISIISNYAKDNDLKLFLVMTRYSSMEETLQQESGEFFYSIKNSEFEKRANKYIKSFEDSLGYSGFSNNKYMGNYLFFEKDKIVGIKKSIFED
jgi:hypothetical protein